MNSYPHEFLHHPQPLMFVAGLTGSEASSSSTTITKDRSASILSIPGSKPNSRRPSFTNATLDPGGLRSPAFSPGPTSSQVLPISPPADSSRSGSPPLFGEQNGDSTVLELDHREREFLELSENLRRALSSMSGKGRVWLPRPERRNFRILLVDKGVRLPMRKIASPSQNSTDSPPAPRSPLSPLTTTSPLYPDGLIAPIWVRKHAELIPSVFVLFLRLYESPFRPAGTDIIPEDISAEKAKEREMDEALVQEVGERRRRLGERGIKLTVVLMASSDTLDSPALDPRLSFVRRASALSSKASLFVLTPVPADQLPDFVQSLQDALYDSAMEYYAAHAKRVRRKRSRLPINQLGIPPGSGAVGRALGPQGWGVRYDWKAGWFAEARGELDAAKRCHYEDCWNELARMFGSTQTLPPRTKRWAEAKVLADCVAMRICRLHLYEGQVQKVLGPFFVHLKRFGDLSRGWGIGEETFEFWSWIARQYRIFAELLELGMQSGLSIPQLAPPIFPTAASAAAPPAPEYFATPISASNPLQVLQQPAFYFYSAACCSVQRQKRYAEAVTAEEEATRSGASAAPGYVSSAPGFANEKKVDHAALIVELFTRAYSLYKSQEYAHSRLALLVAYQIAETHVQAGQYDMAMRFFERVSSTFKQNRWKPIVREIRKMWYECAQHTGSVEVAYKLLLEMMCPGSGFEGAERESLQEDLLSLLKTTAPLSSEPISTDFGQVDHLIDVRSGFWRSEASIGSAVPFQVSLVCPATVDISALPFTSLRIVFSDDRPEITIEHAEDKSRVVNVGVVKMESLTCKANLHWEIGSRLVISGELQSDLPEDIKIDMVRLHLKQGSWDIQLNLQPGEIQEWVAGSKCITPVGQLSPSISFITRAHAIEVDISHSPSALIGENLPLTVNVRNTDDREVGVKLSVYLRPGDEDDGSIIRADSAEDGTQLKDLDFGLLSPGASGSRIIHLRAQKEGTKSIDFIVRSTTPSPVTSPSEGDNGDDGSTPHIQEHTKKVDILVVAPFHFQSRVTYRPTTREGVLSEAIVACLISLPGPMSLSIESLDLRSLDLQEAELLSTSISPPAQFLPQTWISNNTFSLHAHFALRQNHQRSQANPDTTPAELILHWRRSGSNEEELIRTIIPLPPFSLPPRDSFIIATLHPPTTITLHEPFDLSLGLTNTHPPNPHSHSSGSGTELSVQVETTDAFVFSGPRFSHLQPILPGESKVVRLRMMGIGGGGWVGLPIVRVWEGVGEDQEEVVVDMDGGVDGRRGRMVYVRP